MADNASYDARLNVVPTQSLIETQAAMAREEQLKNQGSMIAPAPLEMTPEEKLLSYEKQNGMYNPGGDVEMASNFAEGNLAAQAFPQPAQAAEPTLPSLNPETDFLETEANVARAQEQQQINFADPLFAKIKAQDDLNNAAQTLEKNRQGNLAEKESLQNAQVEEYANFKKKYDADVSTRLMELDNDLKRVDEDARASRKTTAELFQDKSSGQKFAAGIAMILGAAGGVMTGKGGNVGIDIINNTLESERRQLISNFANSKEMLDLKRKNLDDYNEAVMKQMQVADRQKILQLQVLNTKLDVAESQYRGSAAGAAAKDAKANIQMQINSMKQQQIQAEAMSKYANGSASIDELPLQAAAAFLGQKPGEVLKNRQERTVFLPGSTKPNYAIDPSSAEKARKIIGPSEEIQKAVAEIAEIVKNNPLEVKAGGFTKAGTRAQAAMGRITAAMKDIKTLGALDNGVFLLVDGIVANPTKLINQADYNKIRNDLKQGVNVELEALGVRGYAIPNPKYKFQKAGEGMVEAKFGKYLPKQQK